MTPRTKIVVVCNPNNPTGARIPADELNQVCRIAGRVGAWVLSDEIYRGAELDSVETPTMWGRYERVIVTSGLSKAYGLPGLRLGWVAGPRIAHRRAVGRPRLHIHRARRDERSPGPHRAVPPRADSRANPRHRRRELPAGPQVDREACAENCPRGAGSRRDSLRSLSARHQFDGTDRAIRREKSVLLVPGDHFDMDGYIRIGFGNHPGHVASALELVGEVLDRIQ